MQLSKRARLESDKCGRNVFADREVCRVDFVELAAVAAYLFGRVFQRAVHKGAVSAGDGRRGVCHILRADFGIQDVWVLLGDIIED